MMKKILFVLLFTAALTEIVWAQGRTVSGKVLSQEDGLPLPGVNVMLKGTTTGTTTDVEGGYKLNVPDAGGTLVFSFIGFSSLEAEIGNRQVIEIKMATDTSEEKPMKENTS